jgi:uncharacterized membrane protein
VAAGVGALIALLAVVYPVVLESALDRLGVRTVSLALAAGALVSLPLRGPARGGRAVGTAGLAGLLIAAAVTEERSWLRLVPAWVYACLAGAAAASLREPESLMERAARWLVPEAPDFIGGYCRAVTALWSVLFLAGAAAIAALAVAGTPEGWRTFTSRTLWIAMAVLTAIEFLVRKTWFRYYARGGPFERVWSTLFPAERTARGRRSMAAIAQWRERSAADSAEASADR